MNTPAFELDATRFPLVMARERGGLSDAARAELLDKLDELVSRRGRHALVLDLRSAMPVPEAQKTFIAERWHMTARMLVEKWACVSVAVSPPLLRGLPVGAFWLKAAPVPAKLFPGIEPATQWARGVLNHSVSVEPRTMPEPVGSR